MWGASVGVRRRYRGNTLISARVAEFVDLFEKGAPVPLRARLRKPGATRLFKKERGMQLGMIGLGRMGANMARRLLAGGHDCVVFDRSPDAVATLVTEKATGASSLTEFAARLATPDRKSTRLNSSH